VEEMAVLCIPDEDEDEVPAPRVPEDKEEEVLRCPPEEDDIDGVLAVKRPRASRFCMAALWRLPPPRPRAADPLVRAFPPPRLRAKDLSLRALPPRPPLTWVALVRPLDLLPALATDPSTLAI
jgi:hypothetical protein